MADDAPDPEPPAAIDAEVTDDASPAPASALAPEPEPEPPASPTAPRIPRRTIGIALALVAIVGVIAIDMVSIVGAAQKPGASASASSAPDQAPAAATVPSGAAAEVERTRTGNPPVFDDNPEPPAEDEPKHEPRAPREAHDRHASRGTVLEAATRSCSTSSVDGLSRQIIRQSRCIDPDAFVAVPKRPNLVTRSNVFLYMEAPARDHLLKALDANKKQTMTVNSSLRTVAQQYLLWRWYANRICGIHLATRPGDSNHETGLALDIAEAPAWRPTLEKHDFHWLGAIDNMHFDYKGPGASSHSSVDVKAFQQLWNRNHADNRIAENGRYTPETEDRLKKSPAAGFPHGPHCGR